MPATEISEIVDGWPALGCLTARREPDTYLRRNLLRICQDVAIFSISAFSLLAKGVVWNKRLSLGEDSLVGAVLTRVWG